MAAVTIAQRHCLSRVPSLGPPPSLAYATDSDTHRTLLTDQDNQPGAASDPRVKQVPLQHGVVLGQDRDDDGGYSERKNWAAHSRGLPTALISMGVDSIRRVADATALPRRTRACKTTRSNF